MTTNSNNQITVINTNTSTTQYQELTSLQSFNKQDQYQLVRDVLNKPNLTDEQLAKQSDLCQLVLHNIENVKKNQNITSLTEINVHKSKHLPQNAWSDIYVTEQMNKISLFNQQITEYKLRVNNIKSPGDCFIYLKDVSKEITISLLKLLNIRDRGGDRSALIDVLTTGINTPDLTGIIHILPIYNILLYSLPYALSLSIQDPSILLSIQHAPYEHCLNIISTLNMDISTVNINWYLRTQARLEGNLPNVGWLRDMYETMRPLVLKSQLLFDYRYRYLSIVLFNTARQSFLPLITYSGNRFLYNTPVVPSTSYADIPLLDGTSQGMDELGERLFLQIMGFYV